MCSRSGVPLSNPCGDISGNDMWDGIYECSPYGEIRSLEISYAEWGTIPSTVALLTALTDLEIYRNSINGTIPPSIGQLTNLVYLYLYSNCLTGTIPVELGNLIYINDFDLDSNALTGTLPTAVTNFPYAEYYDLDSNMLSGTLPSELATVGALLGSYSDIYVYSNKFTGYVPSELVCSDAYFYLEDMSTVVCQQPCTDEIGETVSGPVERRLKLEVYFDLPSCDGMMITDCCDMSCGN